MPATHRCPYCDKQLKTERGVTQHVFQSPECRRKQQQEISLATKATKRNAPSANEPRRSTRLEQRANEPAVPRQFAARSVPPEPTDQEADDTVLLADDTSDAQLDAKPAAKRTKRDSNLEEDTEHSDLHSNRESEDEDSVALATNQDVNTSIRDAFRAYCDNHKHNFLPLTKQDATCVKLMHVLKRKAPLNAHTSVLEWHLKEVGELQPDQKVGDATGHCHRATPMKKLLPRYNPERMKTEEMKVRLPSSKAVVSIPVRSAADCIVTLLTDPRFEASDCLFFGNDPLAPPPEKTPCLADLNTGEAHLKSHEKSIAHERQVLSPVPMCIDGAVTGQFTDLPVTAVKLALGIHTREARDRQHAWSELGFIPVVRKDPARGKKTHQESGHMDSQDVMVLEGEGDPNQDGVDTEEEDEEEDGAVKAQDFHTMLKAILQSFVELQRTGFVWDLMYNGKLYQDIEFVIFVPFVKCDTEEADVLCGKCTVRTKNVKHVCRYCHCPTSDADNPLAKYRLKTQPEIQNLVEKKKLSKLQQISQQYIQNAWYKVRFHQANLCGVHGACPSEKLHAIQLGIFKYLREIFFAWLHFPKGIPRKVGTEGPKTAMARNSNFLPPV